MKLRAVGVAGILMLFSAQGVQAAQQCVGALGTTTYGSLSVTVGGTGCAAFGPAGPFASSVVIFAGGVCTVSFSAPVDTSSIVVGVDSLDSSLLSATVNGASYAIQPGDIVESPIPGAPYAPGNPIVASGGGVTANGVGSEGSGRFSIGSAAPAGASEVAISQSSTGSGTLLEFCFDDAVAPAGPAAVPTLSEWAMIILSLLLAGGAAVYIQRRRSTLV